MMRFLIVALSLCVVSLATLTNETMARTDASDVRVDPQQFAEYRGRVEQELRNGETLVEISRAGRDEVLAILARMADTLADVHSVEQLGAEQKLTLFNDQERLRVLLSEAEEDSRLVCQREKVVGSNRPRKVCLTVAERRRLREDSQEGLRRATSSRPLPVLGGEP